MRVWDCFLFRNELELLELRLETHSKFVDRHVLVESPRTFSNLDKPLVFRESKERFARWSDRIVHVVTDKLQWPAAKGSSLGKPARMEINGQQWEAIRDALKPADDDDVVMLSDVDEIIRPSSFLAAVEMLSEHERVLASMRLYYYFLNGYRGKGWKGTVLMKVGPLRKQESMWDLFIKSRTTDPLPHVKDAGWHFSYLGGPSRVVSKLLANAHNEYDASANMKSITEAIEGGVLFQNGQRCVTYVPLDDSFPEHLLRNRERFAEFIREV